MTFTSNNIIALLKSHRFFLHNEKSLQSDIAALFTSKKVPFNREHYLDENNIMDFIVADGIGLEIKIDGTKRAIYEQCLRYSKFPEVKELILFTNKQLGTPHLYEGKRFNIVNIGTAWF